MATPWRVSKVKLKGALFIHEEFIDDYLTSGRSPDLGLKPVLGLSFPKAFPRSAQWQMVRRKRTEAFTVAGPCGIHTRFPILQLPRMRQTGT
jgi:hypothetical protein